MVKKYLTNTSLAGEQLCARPGCWRDKKQKVEEKEKEEEKKNRSSQTNSSSSKSARTKRLKIMVGL